MTRLTLFLGSLALALVCLLTNGCYTQVGASRSDEDGQYGTEDQQGSLPPDSAVTEEQPTEQYAPPYDGYGYYYPGFSMSFGWYPWAWGGYPYYYDPFWGPPIYSYYPYYYNPYPAYYGYYHPPYAYYPYTSSGGAGHGVTRNFGNSRGSGVRGGDPYLRYPVAGGVNVVRPGYLSDRRPPVTMSSQSGRTTKSKSVNQSTRHVTGRTASGTTRTVPYSQPRTTREGTGTTRSSGPQASRPVPSRPAPSAPGPSPSGGGRSQSSGPRGR